MEVVEATSESGPGRRGRRARGQALPPLAPATHRVDVDVEWVLMMVMGAISPAATIKSLPHDVLAIEVLLEPALDDREHLDPRCARVLGEAFPTGRSG